MKERVLLFGQLKLLLAPTSREKYHSTPKTLSFPSPSLPLLRPQSPFQPFPSPSQPIPLPYVCFPDLVIVSYHFVSNWFCCRYVYVGITIPLFFFLKKKSIEIMILLFSLTQWNHDFVVLQKNIVESWFRCIKGVPKKITVSLLLCMEKHKK